MMNIFESLELHYVLFCNIVGKKHAIIATFIYHLVVLILMIVLLENL